MKTSQLRAIIREELLSELREAENTEYGSMYSSPKQQQSEMDMLLKQAEELKQMRDDLTRQIEQLEIIANTFNVNEAGLFGLKNPDDAKKGYQSTIDPDDTTEKSADFLRKYKKLNEEEQLDEMAKITEPIQSAINIATNRLKSQFPEITADQIKSILTSKKKAPEYAPELVKALDDDEKMHGGDIKYTIGIGGPQTLRAVEKALGEYEPLPRGRKAGEPKAKKPATPKTEKPAAEKKAEAPKAEKTAAPKAEKPAAAKSEPVDKEDAAALRSAAKVKGGALTKAEKYAKLDKEFNRIDTELRSLAKDSSPEAMAKRRVLSGDKTRIEMAMAKLKQI
jgi:hypothetical protein